MFFDVLTAGVVSFVFGILFHRIMIPLGRRFQMVAFPNYRRRHSEPISILGGVAVFSAVLVGLGFFCMIRPEWAGNHLQSVGLYAVAVFVLVVIGLLDDRVDIRPAFKMFFQFFAAGIILLEPNVHTFLSLWESALGFWVWPLAMFWIVGVTNAINLIDGIDGLASGTGIAIAGAILYYCVTGTAPTHFPLPISVLIMFALGSFLVFNLQQPAKVFLGDNGSLPLGFLLASFALTARPLEVSAQNALGLVLIFGYPILDSFTTVITRYVKKRPALRADRNHLHHWLLRLGFSSRRALVLLFGIVLYLEMIGVFVTESDLDRSLFYILAGGLSVGMVYFLLVTVEKWKVKQILRKIDHRIDFQNEIDRSKFEGSITIDLVPLLKSSDTKEVDLTFNLIKTLEFMLKLSIRKQDDRVKIDAKSVVVLISEPELSERDMKSIYKRVQSNVDSFIKLFNVPVTLNSLPMVYEFHNENEPKKKKSKPRLTRRAG